MAYNAITCPRTHIPKFNLDPNSYSHIVSDDSALGWVNNALGFVDLAACKAFLGRTDVDVLVKMVLVNQAWLLQANIEVTAV